MNISHDFKVSLEYCVMSDSLLNGYFLIVLQGAERGQFVQTANLTFEATLDSQSKAPPHGNINNNHDRRSVSAASLFFHYSISIIVLLPAQLRCVPVR
jgi:hypothetical protein